MMDRIKDFLKSDRFRELFAYLLAGVGTTVVNYVVYFLVTRGGGLIAGVPADHWLVILIAKIIAWIAAVAFAFWSNKKFVFRSDDWSRAAVLREVIPFGAARLLSLGIDMAFVELTVQVFGMNDMLATLLANVIVLIANYFASKLWIFRKKG